MSGTSQPASMGTGTKRWSCAGRQLRPANFIYSSSHTSPRAPAFLERWLGASQGGSSVATTTAVLATGIPPLRPVPPPPPGAIWQACGALGPGRTGFFAFPWSSSKIRGPGPLGVAGQLVDRGLQAAEQLGNVLVAGEDEHLVPLRRQNHATPGRPPSARSMSKFTSTSSRISGSGAPRRAK